MKRRTFLDTLAVTGAGLVTLPRLGRASTRLDRIGLELYSVRNAMRKDPEATLAAIRAIGYTDVELLWSFDNFGRTPQQVRATLDHEGLRAPSAHLAPEALLKDWDRSLETAKLLGHQFLIVPSLPSDAQRALEPRRLWAERFNAAGAAARKAGVWLAFHNEPEDTRVIDGKIAYDYFVDLLDPNAVRLQLDVGNMLLGGGDPMHYLAKYRDRVVSFHIKDVVADGKRDTELGTGTFDFRRFLAAVPGVKSKPCYVEQEAAKDELASAAVNWKYLNALSF